MLVLARRYAPWAAGLAALAALVLLVDTRAVVESMQHAHLYRFVPLIVLFVLLWFLIESANLSDLLGCFGLCRPFREVLAARAFTYLLMVLNYGLGVAAMALYIRGRSRTGLGRASSIMLFYTHAEMLALCALTLAGAPWAHGDPVLATVGTLAAGYLAAAVLMYRFGRHPPVWLPARIREAALLSCFRTAGLPTLLRLAIGRAFYFASFVFFFHSALPAFGIDVPLSVLLVTVPAIFLVGNLPVTAAGVGTIQAAMLAFFSTYGPAAAVLAFSICYSAALILLRLMLGAIAAFSHPALLSREDPRDEAL
jgi:hypothetical protein